MSNYKTYFDENKVEVNKRAIATKIIDMIQQLELNNTEESGRRWIWELIQNAKDVSDEQVCIEVRIDSDKVLFSHNGKPFKVIHLTSLINQVSAKDRNDASTTGKFGTGFLTTHLLSKKVELKSILKEKDQPYKPFKIELDRRSSDIHELSRAVEKTMRTLDNVDETKNSTYIPGEMSTTFTYYLETEQSKRIAQIGYEDLRRCIDYVLVCQPKVREVCINNERITSRKLKDLTGALKAEIYEIKKGTYCSTYIKVIEQNTSIMAPISIKDNIICLEDIGPFIPRLFCDFPCVGTEQFRFPVVINDSTFYLTEPRDGIYLTNNPHEEIERNREIMKIAINLWEQLFHYIASQNTPEASAEKLLYFPEPKYYEWQDESYIENEIIGTMCNKAITIPFISVTYEDKLYPIQDVCFPDFETAEQVEWSHLILKALQRKPLANSKYLQKYRTMLCPREDFIGYEPIINIIEKQQTLKKLDYIICNDTKAIELINNTLKLLQLDEFYKDRLKRLKLFPMLDGSFNHALSKISLNKVQEPIRTCYIQHLKKGYYGLSEYFDLELDLTGLEFQELTTLEVIRILNREQTNDRSIHTNTTLVCATPPKDHPLYEKQQRLFNIVAYDYVLAPYSVDDYTEDYLEQFDVAYIRRYIKDKRYVDPNFNTINAIISYLLDYNLSYLGREMTVLFNEQNISKNYVHMRYNKVTKPALYDLYKLFIPEVDEKIVSSSYQRLEELVTLSPISDNLVINEINKQVFELLSVQNPTISEQEKLQAVYDYLQANIKDIDEEFPSLKEKMYFMCSKEVMLENQTILQEIRQLAKDNGWDVETCMKKLKEAQDTDSDNLLDMGDYSYGHEVTIETYMLDRIRHIGNLGEQYGFAIIIQNYQNEGYTIMNEKDLIITLQKDDSTIEVQSFYGTHQEGYDIRIKENGEIIKYIEIKATIKPCKRYVKISKMQLAKASECYWDQKVSYQLMCLMDIESPSIRVAYIDNPFEQLYQNKALLEVAISLE